MTNKNILVAVDMTDEAADVLKAAVDVANDESKISIVTVIPPLSDFYINLYSVLDDSPNPEIDSDAMNQAIEWLSGLVEGYEIGAENVRVILGKPATEIRELAKELKTDLIVIGMHDRNGLGRMLGSTANGVLHGVPCNVLTVKVKVD